MTVGDYTHAAPDYGVVQRDHRDFKKGESYPVTVQHAGSTYATGGEDFDYRAWVDRYAAPTWTSGDPIPSGHEFMRRPTTRSRVTPPPRTMIWPDPWPRCSAHTGGTA